MLETLPLLIASSTSLPTPKQAACTNRVTKMDTAIGAVSRFIRNYTLGDIRGLIKPDSISVKNVVKVERYFWSRTEKQDPRPPLTECSGELRCYRQMTTISRSQCL
ncbi:hypothetical protein LY76DRAFT_44482 [Colletotrichum caudatum]|nr:hypothetical protein LY76DRAFT_44482 [Colletotrichum caudatum]